MPVSTHDVVTQLAKSPQSFHFCICCVTASTESRYPGGCSEAGRSAAKVQLFDQPHSAPRSVDDVSLAPIVQRSSHVGHYHFACEGSVGSTMLVSKRKQHLHGGVRGLLNHIKFRPCCCASVVLLFRVFQNVRTLLAKSRVRGEMLQIAAFWVA